VLVRSARFQQKRVHLFVMRENEMISEQTAPLKQSGSTKGNESQGTGVATEQLIITTNTETGEIVNVETIDSSGERRDAPDDKLRQIAGEDEVAEIADALDAAFDAAFVDALESTAALEGVEDGTEADPVLERLIVFRLLGRHVGRDLRAVRRGMLRRLVLRRLARRYVLNTRTEEIRP
jgi:hypothetical protein